MANGGVEMNLVDKLIEMDHKSPKRIMVIGDGMTDVYVNGKLETCQDNCLKFVEESLTRVDGGAANAVRSLKNWRAYRIFIYPTYDGPVKTRFMVGNECKFRYDNDKCDFDLEAVRQENLLAIETWKPDGVLLSDYDKGLLTPSFIRYLITICNARNIPCVADAKREPELYRGALLKCNAPYALKYQNYLTNVPMKTVVTRGEVSPLIWQVNEDIEELPDMSKVECINHVGAGDCFASHLTLALAYGFSLKESAAIAHSAGRVYVQHRHNRPPMPEEISRDLIG